MCGYHRSAVAVRRTQQTFDLGHRLTDLICDVCGQLSSAQFYKQPCYAVLLLCVVWCVGSGVRVRCR